MNDQVNQARRFIIVVAAGSGSRLVSKSATPKAFCEIRGKSILQRSLEAVLRVAGVVGVVTVVPPGFESRAAQDLNRTEAALGKTANELTCVAGAETRHQSVCRGLAALEQRYGLFDSDLVAIHDAARCLVTPEVFTNCFDAAQRCGAATAAAAVRDTIKRAASDASAHSGGAPTATRHEVFIAQDESISRTGLFAMQTPQVFRYQLLKRGMQLVAQTGADAPTDEVSVVQSFAAVQIVAAPFSNFKITFPEDIAIAEALCLAREC